MQLPRCVDVVTVVDDVVLELVEGDVVVPVLVLVEVEVDDAVLSGAAVPHLL